MGLEQERKLDNIMDSSLPTKAIRDLVFEILHDEYEYVERFGGSKVTLVMCLSYNTYRQFYCSVNSNSLVIRFGDSLGVLYFEFSYENDTYNGVEIDFSGSPEKALLLASYAYGLCNKWVTNDFIDKINQFLCVMRV